MHHSAADQPSQDEKPYIPLDKKPGLLMGPHQTRAQIQLFCLWTVFSAFITELQSSTVSKGHATLTV